MINFCVFVMIASAIVKTLHPAQVVAYMGSMGYQGATLFLIAALELLSGIVFLLPATRVYGLLLVSAYFGGGLIGRHGSSGGELSRPKSFRDSNITRLV
jgi:uncharacterized membrane protein YphA (DoxX/SURF4 family)